MEGRRQVKPPVKPEEEGYEYPHLRSPKFTPRSPKSPVQNKDDLELNRSNSSGEDVPPSMASSSVKRLLLETRLETKKKLLLLEREREKEKERILQLERESKERIFHEEKEILMLEQALKMDVIQEQGGIEEDQRIGPEDEILKNLTQMKMEEKIDGWKTASAGTSSRTPSPPPDPTPQVDPRSSPPPCGHVSTPCVAHNNPRTTTEEKLTKILAHQSVSKDLPVFEGNPMEWPFFVSRYKETTELFGFSDTENMSRLIKCLKGPAKDIASGLLLSSKNVPLVLKKLEMNFGQPQQIIRGLISKVQKAQDVKEDKPETIIALDNAVSTLVANVIALDRDDYLQNPQLMEELENKLHGSLRTKWIIEKSGKDFPNLNDFGDFITALATAFSKSSTYQVPDRNEKKGSTEKKRVQNVHAVDSPQVDTKSRNPADCSFCSRKGHNLSVCRNFKKEAPEKKWEFVKSGKICFLCLKTGHRVKDCNPKTACGVDGCQLHHHPALHSARKPEVQENEQVFSSSCGNDDSQPLLRIIPVELTGPKGSRITFALLDEGSTVTMIRASLAKELGIRGSLEPLRVQWFDKTPKLEKESERINVTIRGDYPGAKTYTMNNVRTIEDFALKSYSLDVQKLKCQWPHLKRLKMKSMANVIPMLLIGIDNAKLTAHREILENSIGPMATRTRLGWAVGGGGSPGQLVSTCHIHEVYENDESTHALVQEFFSTEQFGVQVNETVSRSKDDLRALAILDETARRVSETKWEVGLLWKNDEPNFPESRQNALSRLNWQEKKMDKNPNFAKEYCAKIEEYEKKGYIKKVTNAEDHPTPKSWFLPHFGVLNPNKPGKLRLVFDAAAKSHGVSLNSELLTGPDFQNNLQAVLWRFRERPVAFMADITDMFHRVLIRKDDLPSQRFLWRGMDRMSEPGSYQMNVMIFGATSSPSTAIYVKNRTATEFEGIYPEAAKEIRENFYMDDYLGCAWSEEEAVKLIPEVIEINSRADFTLCKFVANSTTVLDSIPENLRSTGVKNLTEKSELPVERVLGLWWNADNDTFTFKINYHKVPDQILKCKKVPTKREMARLVMSIYDPIGFVAPFKIKGLVLLQSAWRQKIGWDEPIPDSLNEDWKEWVNEIPKILDVQVCRNYSPNLKRSSNQLHIFMDASEEAFSAAAYVRAEYDGKVEVSLMAAKVRVSPLKHLTIPKLELQAAVMGSRLADSLRGESRINFERTVYWSDSTTVLNWLKSTSGRFERFVNNRVTEVLNTSKPNQWRWIPTKLNVADDATRKSKPCDFDPKGRWYVGPEFLKFSEEHWPAREEESTEELEVCTQVSIKKFKHVELQVPDPDRFSSWTRLLRATTAVRVMAKLWREKAAKNTDRNIGIFTVEDLKVGETTLWKRVQLDAFPEELNCLHQVKPIEKNSRLYKLNPFLDEEGLIRIKGRIQDIPDVPVKNYQPVVLAPKHQITKLIIDNAHLQGGHCGQERAVNLLREKFWILDIRSAVRSAWNRCQDCNNRRVKPINPQMGNLPLCRLQLNKPAFSSTGVDYFGPMTVTIGRRHEKRWGVLFTCLTTRGIHLELSPSLETDQMLMALMRFINRRGKPDHMHSDNGTNFVGADAELKKCLLDLDQTTIASKLANQGITWHFIPPAAPHMGGSWERLVQTVKKTLTRLLKEQSPKEYTLLTLLTEVENIVNGRPLTHVSNDPDDPEALTPNHFLRPSTFIGPSLASEFEDGDLFRRKQWRIAQRMADHFWARWVKEYLPTLQKREKWNEPVDPVRIGDIVIVVNDQLPRNNWKKGIILDIFPGKDGIIRVVQVKTTEGVYLRPVAKVCPMRLRISDECNPSSGGRNVAGAQEPKP